MTREQKDARQRVRRSEPRDVECIRTIAQQSPEAAQWSEEMWRRIDCEGQSAWAVESPKGDVVGFLVARTVASDEAEILNLAVAPANRRSGSATQLLQACIDEFSRLKIKRVFLEVRESNAAAIAFYEGQKFVRTGRRPAYYQRPPEAAVLLVRILTA
jgi:ribosomal-protein-alanine acetyltransferase